uniref:RNA-directed DNA polymerase, eukaryota, reverse transcriptase zinc-binding domain protein n=1 Tax=Tanacetum cinerariifolium TaxID=118510 RepID=A0A6L2LWW0_TANCI|nr:RNA-directed DNA polymerase, eukaryota, reverse transcriptase zinc-binding domain protein [Tanacetum cinerariifolium]
MLGWNTDTVNQNVIHYAKQSLLCRVDIAKRITKLFCTFVYAANGGNERRELWKDLKLYKRIVEKEAWVMLGDINFALAPNEHSSGSSFMIGDMNEFRDCINNIEMEDAKKRAFKFFNFLADKEEFLPLKLSWKNGNVFENIKKLRDKLKELQINIDKALDLKKIRGKDSIVIINTIHYDYGNKYEGDDVVEQFVRHFKNFLSEAVQVKHMKNINMLIKNKLSEAEANEMVRDVSDVEIKEAMFLIDGNKASGHGGFSSLFFKRAWNIVGEDVCKAVKEFFLNGMLLIEINSTVITLVPNI